MENCTKYTLNQRLVSTFVFSVSVLKLLIVVHVAEPETFTEMN